MSKSNTLENQIQDYIFRRVAPPWAGDNQFYVALHTADPGESGTQATSEVSYTGYARVLVARPAGWDVTNNTASNVAEVAFPIATGAADDVTATHFSIGTAASGAGTLLEKGPLTTPVRITQNILPRFAAGGLQSQED